MSEWCSIRTAAWILCSVLLLYLGTAPADAHMVKTFRLQLGSLDSAEAAQALRQKAVKELPFPVFVDFVQGRYKITAGDFALYEEAAAQKELLIQEGFRDAFVVQLLTSISDELTEPPIYRVQMGNFRIPFNARQLQRELQERGVTEVSIDQMDNFYKVRVGRYQDRTRAMEALEILHDAGYPDAYVLETQASDALIERTIVSMEPASPASLEPPPSPLRPQSLDKESLSQVVLGPYSILSAAEKDRLALLDHELDQIRLVRSGGYFWIEVASPAGLLRAEDTKKMLREKGFQNVTTRKIGPPATPVIPLQIKNRLEKLQAEVEQIRQRPTVSPPGEDSEATLQVAQRLMAEGHYQAAREQLEEAIKNDPGNSAIIEGLSACLNAIREQEQAEHNKVATNLLLTSAEKLMASGQYNAARIQYELLLQEDRGNRAALEGLVKAFERARPREARVSPVPSPSLAGTGSEPFAFLSWVGWILGTFGMGAAAVLLILRRRQGVPAQVEVAAADAVTSPISPSPSRGAPSIKLPQESRPEVEFDTRHMQKTLGNQIPSEPLRPPAKPRPEEEMVEEVVFEQSHDFHQASEEVNHWKGDYENAALKVSTNPILSPDYYLKFIKEPSQEEVFFQHLVPPAGLHPVVEFDLCCVHANEHPLGVRLGSQEHEAVSLATEFRFSGAAEQLSLTVGREEIPYNSAEWRHFRFEIDLDHHVYSVQVNRVAVVRDEPLPASVKKIDIIKLTAKPATDGTLLLMNLKVSRRTARVDTVRL